MAQFLDDLNLEKERQWKLIERWWRSPQAFEAHWNELGGFDEDLCRARVAAAFYEEYSRVIHKALAPVLGHRVSETPAMQVMLKKIKGYVFSDVYERALKADTVEDVYFLLGDDLTHLLIAYLASDLKAESRSVR